MNPRKTVLGLSSTGYYSRGFLTHPDVAQKYSPFRSLRYGLEQNLQYTTIRMVLNQVTGTYQLGDYIIRYCT